MPDVTRRHFDSPSFEKPRFVAAIRRMRAMPAPGFASLYDKYIDWHATAGFNAVAHFGLAFLAWHRAFMWEFERDLQAADMDLGENGRIGAPWWDWYNDTSPDPLDARGHMWHDDFLGPDGTPPSGEVMSGHFIHANWPGGPLLAASGEPDFLHRSLGVGPLATTSDIHFAVSLSAYDVPPYDAAAPETSFRNVLEGNNQRADDSLALHNAAHGWIGGNMNNVRTSPFEPAFWLNHSNVDRVWATWQAVHPQLATQWPTDAEIDAAYPPPMVRPPSVLKLDEPMIPWDGSAGTRIWTPRSVLGWQTMGPAGEHQYRYSTDPPGSFSFT